MMQNKTTILLVFAALMGAGVISVTSAIALNDNCVNQVSMNFTADNWVNSDTSLVSVAISASVPEAEVDKVTDTIKIKLAKASGKKNWRLVNLTRNESDSGLIALSGQASARLNNNELGALQAQLKSLNKPGEKYVIANIDHQPDQATMNKSQSELRVKLYNEINEELKSLNVALSDKQSSPYQIHKISFNNINSTIQPVMIYKAAAVRDGAMQDSSNRDADDASISGKISMSAYVTYSAIIPGCNMDDNAAS